MPIRNNHTLCGDKAWNKVIVTINTGEFGGAAIGAAINFTAISLGGNSFLAQVTANGYKKGIYSIGKPTDSPPNLPVICVTGLLSLIKCPLGITTPCVVTKIVYIGYGQLKNDSFSFYLSIAVDNILLFKMCYRVIVAYLAF
jgi:uncharacterized membrane protein